MSSKFTKVDDLIRPDHVRLRVEDQCFFLREYVARGGFKAGDTNNWILNLKKPVDRRGLPQWDYKEKAIKRFAFEIAAALPPARSTWAIVPMPPHCSRGDAQDDDRMERVAEIVAQQSGWPNRALLYTRQTRQPLHATNDPRDPAQIADTLAIDEGLANPEPEGILLLDDVLTTGCSMVAASLVLRHRFPTAEILAIFIARRVFPKPELDDDGGFVISG